ncbi:MAG: hypothetical protein FJ087_02870 [Deltaproteobacteria bacterium]|nr:hypothetical protein [Deltaproteobacteria bacterium]
MCHDHGDRGHHEQGYGRGREHGRQHGHEHSHGGHGHEHRHQHEHEHGGPDHRGGGRDGGPDRPGRPRGGCECGCHGDEGGFGFERRFVSKAEVIETLREYLKDLEGEAQGVREAIAEMEAEAAAAAAPKPEPPQE